MKPVVLVALWLLPWSLLAYPTVTVSPDEEQNLNHYVQVLQNLILSVPTNEPSPENNHPKSPSHIESPEARSVGPSDSPEARSVGPSDIPETRPLLPPETEWTGPTSSTPVTSPVDEVLMDPEDTSPLSTSSFSTGRRRKTTTESTTAFWSIKPNNVSVVLHADEPYIVPEPEPEPDFESESKSESESEPESEPLESESVPKDRPDGTRTLSNATRSTTLRVRNSVAYTTSKRRADVEMTTDITEDVPQLSGYPDLEGLDEPLDEEGSQALRNEDILRKISELSTQLRRAPVGDRNSPQYRKFIRESREHLKRSLALAAAAEHKLLRMYSSRLFGADSGLVSSAGPGPGGGGGGGGDDADTVLDVLYRARDRLSDYLDLRQVSLEMRDKATVVSRELKKTLCAEQLDTQRLIRKLLSNNIRILNLLDIP